MIKTVLAIRHLAFEDLGLFADVLTDAGYQIRYVDVWRDDLAEVDRLDPDLLVVLGGPIGVYEDDVYPFLTTEIELLRRRLARGRPVLGVCLGAQLIARAQGAAVYPGKTKEIGWSPVTLSEIGAQSVLAPLAQAGVQVLHWHGDTFDLPEGATLLASTPLTPHQAFSLGDAVLALQFHLEADPSQIEAWLIGHTGELNQIKVDIPALRVESQRAGALLAPLAAEILRAWLTKLPHG